ncbi:MAG TPA: ribose-phosphate pyrophosphokinase [Gemmatimonadales bacterium]|nr:ribose-phosphate pyrophosphokinase [Gemmatimonadales bacterium]
MALGELTLFALNASRAFGAKVAEAAGLALAPHEERSFEDGEHKARPLVNVRGRDVFVVQSLYGEPEQSAADKLCRLLFFIATLKDAAADRVTALVPYLCYARKDRKTKPRDPVTTRYVAALFEAVGTDRIVTIDVHNLAAFQNAFRCGTDHLEAKRLFVEYFAPRLTDVAVVVVSPDVGGVKRADEFRDALARTLACDVALAVMEKQRSAGVVSGEALVGDVRGRVAILIDDLVSTGTTLARTATACRERGATRVLAAATHGVFTAEANVRLAEPALTELVVSDTIPSCRLTEPAARQKLVTLNAASLFAAAARRLHEGGSLVELLEP